jgi:hypothetical protein
VEQIHFAISQKTCCQRRSPVDQCPAGGEFQSFDVVESLAGGGHGEGVAAEFALAPQASREPPNGRVIKEDRFGETLQQVHPQIEPPQVSQFVGNDGFQQIRRQFQQPGTGQEDHGANKSSRDGFAHPVAGEDDLRDRHAKAGAEPSQARGDVGRQTMAIQQQTPHGEPANDNAQLQQRATQHPAREERWLKRSPQRR